MQKITPNSFDKFRFKDLIDYQSLIILSVKRDFIIRYKQTILGPLWLIIQPIFTSLVQFFIFGKIAKLPSDGSNYFLFLMISNTFWGYFQSSLMKVSETFRSNSNLFGKVYFPRAIIPVTTALSNLVQFLIQFIFVLILMIYYSDGLPSVYMLFSFCISIAIVLILSALLALGLGMIFSSMTTKYRDFKFLIGFFMNALFYISPIVYSSSIINSRLSGTMLFAYRLNPLVHIFDFLRYYTLGVYNYSTLGIWVSFLLSVFVFLLGLRIFSKTQRTFIDVI